MNTFRDFRNHDDKIAEQSITALEHEPTQPPGGGYLVHANRRNIDARRSTDKDPSGAVRILRWVTVFGLLLPVVLLAVVPSTEHSNILAGAERDGTKIVALFRERRETCSAATQ